ncbi:MAG TPA: hypothetical protein VIS03_03160 [Kiloniellaceae bacterium]
MSATYAHSGGAIRSKGRQALARRVADWLALAAGPTFAIMALLAGLPGGGQPDLLCLAAEHSAPLSGMVPMYLLMSAFHLPPWLKLICNRRNGPRQPLARAYRTR